MQSVVSEAFQVIEGRALAPEERAMYTQMRRQFGENPCCVPATIFNCFERLNQAPEKWESLLQRANEAGVSILWTSKILEQSSAMVVAERVLQLPQGYDFRWIKDMIELSYVEAILGLNISVEQAQRCLSEMKRALISDPEFTRGCKWEKMRDVFVSQMREIYRDRMSCRNPLHPCFRDCAAWNRAAQWFLRLKDSPRLDNERYVDEQSACAALCRGCPFQNIAGRFKDVDRVVLVAVCLDGLAWQFIASPTLRDDPELQSIAFQSNPESFPVIDRWNRDREAALLFE